MCIRDRISKGAAQSWQMENRGRTMLADKFDFGFAVDWMRKDLGLCLAEARTRGATLPVTGRDDRRRQAVGIDDLDVVCDRGGLAEHQRCRAILVLRKLHRPLDLLALE